MIRLYLTISQKMTVDNSKNKQVIKNKIIQKVKLPKRITEQDIEKLKKVTMRPNLKDKLNQHIECFGYVIGNYRDMEDRYTVINLIDVNGNIYTADHIQLDFKQNEYNYRIQLDDDGNFIRFEGVVIEYPKNGIVDYTVDLTRKVNILPSNFIMIHDNIDFDNRQINYKKISNYLSSSNMSKIYDLLDMIKSKINECTEGYVSEDFIYYYIINQYFLNQATYYIYEGNLRDQGFSGNVILQILVILSNILKDIYEYSDHTLPDIMKSVAQYCNIIQSVDNYDGYEKNNKFIKFVSTYICNSNSNGKVGKKKLKQLWRVVEYRMTNFDEMNPNIFKLDVDKLTARAYQVINEFIK